VLKCPRCLESLDSFVVFHQATFGTYMGMYHLHCTICATNWFVCKECAGQRSQYKNVSEAQRHIRDKGHENVKDVTTKDDMNVMREDYQSLLVSESDINLGETDTEAAVQSALFPYCSLKQETYFTFNPAILTTDASEGMRYLVANAMHKRIAIECMGDLSINHIMYHANAAYLSSRLTPQEKVCLFNQYYYLTLLYKKGYPIDEYLVPTTMNALNQRYLTGKHSLMQNIPKPIISSLEKHAYISLKACIADLLARHDLDIESVTSFGGVPIRSIYQCSKAQTFIQSVVTAVGLKEPEKQRLILYIIEWSDDFDPAKCIKDNRGSAWIKTVTISAGNRKNQEFRNTYAIAIGHKNDSHEIAEQTFAKELDELRSGNLQFRLGKFGTLVYVYADVLASLQDQIERRSINYIMLGGSRYSARWRLSCDFLHLSKDIPCCASCWMSLRDGIDCMKRCDACLNWETEGVVFKKPKHYPNDLETPVSGCLTSKTITYQTLSDAVSTAISSMSRQQNRWMKKDAECFLATECVNTEMIDMIAKHSKKLRDVIVWNEKVTRARELNAMGRRVVNPRSLIMRELPVWNMPALWNRGVPLSTHIDVPMHLLFLGIVKSTTALVNEWFATKGWNLIADSRTNITLYEIGNLNLTWCRSIPQWKGNKSRALSTSGWVSENYLAFARLILWYYSELISKVLIEGSDEYCIIGQLLSSLRSMISRILTRQVDDKTIHDVRRHIKIFLQSFHIFTEHTTGKTAGKKRVLSRLPAEEINDTVTRKKEAGKKQRLTGSFTETSTRDRVNKTNDRTKKPLTDESIQNIENIDKEDDTSVTREGHTGTKEITSSDKAPLWVSKYNFLCLLNIPEVMSMFGPLRNYWEGGMIGEKILQYAKGSWHGFTKNWQANMLRNIVDSFSIKRTVFDVLQMRSLDTDAERLLEDRGDNYDRNSYHIYKSLDYIQALFDTGVPISVVLLESDVVIAIKNSMCVSIHVHPEDCKTRFGHTYFSASLKSFREMSFPTEKINAYGLLLPLYSHLSNKVDRWTMVTSEWEDIQHDG